MLENIKSKFTTEDTKNGDVTMRHIYRNGVYESSIIYISGWRAGSFKTKAAAEREFKRQTGI